MASLGARCAVALIIGLIRVQNGDGSSARGQRPGGETGNLPHNPRDVGGQASQAQALDGLNHRSGERPSSGVQGFSLGPVHPRLKPWTPGPGVVGTTIKARLTMPPSGQILRASVWISNPFR